MVTWLHPNAIPQHCAILFLIQKLKYNFSRQSILLKWWEIRGSYLITGI